MLDVRLNLQATRTNEEEGCNTRNSRPTWVRDVNASLLFYQEGLGLERGLTVPEQEPFVFVSVVAGDIEIFLNKDDSGSKPAGGMSMYVELEGLDQLLARVQKNSIRIEIPLNETFYGMREFAVLDPDGYMIIFAERKK